MPVELTKPGLQTISHYELVEKIAEGGMGTVHKGRDQITGQLVAIKIVPQHLLNNQVFLKRFEQEYNAAKTVDHPNVVRALDYGREGNVPYLVMEYVEGESLGAMLDRVQRLPEEEAIRIITQVAEGLHRAHEMGLIHRDVKPDNILITADGTARLTDLGLVKELETDLNLTRTGRGLGTPHFMAPEQFRNAKKADVRCDIYSLAATLYMMVTGELPFKSMSPLDAWMKKIQNELAAPKKVLPTLSDRIDWTIRRSMSADPAQRASTCLEFIDDLQREEFEQPVPTMPAGPDLWYMVYKDDEGVVHTVKGTTDAIRRSLRDGLLGDASNIRVARSKQGPFEAMSAKAEFEDLILDPSKTMLAQDMQQIMNEAPPLAPRHPARPKTQSPRPAPSPGSAVATMRAPSNPHLPQIHVARADDDPIEWSKWLLFLIFALGAGTAAFYYMPKILHFLRF